MNVTPPRRRLGEFHRLHRDGRRRAGRRRSSRRASSRSASTRPRSCAASACRSIRWISISTSGSRPRPPPEKEELNRLGLATVDPYTTQAVWKLETTFYWEQTFPPGEEVRRRASLQADHRLRLLRRLGVQRAGLSREILHRRRLRGGGAEEARGDQGHEQPLHERAAGELHPDHRQQLGDVDPGLQAGGRQGQPRRAGQLLRHRREEDLARPSSRCAPRTSCPSANSRSSSPRRPSRTAAAPWIPRSQPGRSSPEAA